MIAPRRSLKLPVETVGVGWWETWRARVNTSWWLVKPLAILLALSLLFMISFIAYTHLTTADTFWRELAIALIGTLLTLLGTLVIALYAFSDELRRRRESATLRRFDHESWSRQSLTVGAMKIPDVVVVASCRQDREWTEHASMRWERLDKTQRAPHSLGVRARAERLPRLVSDARNQAIAFTDDACVDLKGARVDLVRHEGKRMPVYTLQPAVGSYFDFASTTAQLDGPLEGNDALTGLTLREAWDLQLRTIEDVQDLPCMAKVGVGTAVVTSDDRLILGVRGRTMIASEDLTKSTGRARIHIVAEGMIPSDLDGEGFIDPRETAVRGLHEELLIGGSSRDLGAVTELKATGFYFDQTRMQPCFSYLARTNLTWDEIASAAPGAQDFWEVAQLRDLPFDIAHVGLRRLLLNRHPDMEFASNHAAATVWFACLYRFGFHRMRDALSVPVGTDSAR